VDAMVLKAAARVAPFVNRYIGIISRSVVREGGNQNELGNLLAAAYRWAGKGDIGIINTDGIRNRLQAGDITYGKLFLIEPFANTLYRVRMTGAELRGYLERLVSRDRPGVHVSGVTIGYDPDKPAGSRITSLSLAEGRTLADNAVYNVIVNSFMAGGGSNMGPPEGAESKPLNIVDLDGTIEYIKSRPQPLVVPSETRIFVAKQ
jgi:5'-nucleotidase